MLTNLLPRRRQRTPPACPVLNDAPAPITVAEVERLLWFVVDHADDELRDAVLSRAPSPIIAAARLRQRKTCRFGMTAPLEDAGDDSTPGDNAPEDVASDDDALPPGLPTLREIAALRAEIPRVMRPEVLAGFIVQTMRDADPRPGYWLPEDVLTVAADICRTHNIEPVLKPVLLGAIECVPGVRYGRYRILQDNDFAVVRARLRKLGRVDKHGQPAERPHLFWIGEKPAARRGPLRDLDGAAVKPVRRRSDRSGPRPGAGDQTGRVAETREFPEAPDRPARRAA